MYNNMNSFNYNNQVPQNNFGGMPNNQPQMTINDMNQIFSTQLQNLANTNISLRQFAAEISDTYNRNVGTIYSNLLQTFGGAPTFWNAQNYLNGWIQNIAGNISNRNMFSNSNSFMNAGFNTNNMQTFQSCSNNVAHETCKYANIAPERKVKPQQPVQNKLPNNPQMFNNSNVTIDVTPFKEPQISKLSGSIYGEISTKTCHINSSCIIDSNDNKYSYAQFNIKGFYNSPDDVECAVKRIWPNNHNYYFVVEYNQIETLNINYAEGKDVIATLKKAINEVTNKNDISLIVKNVRDVIDAQNRGTADKFEQLLCSRVNMMSKNILHYKTGKPFEVHSISDILYFIDNEDSLGPNEKQIIAQWKSKPKFSENLLSIIHKAIVSYIENIAIVSLENEKCVREIVKAIPTIHVDKTGNVVLVDEILDSNKFGDYVKASIDEKKTLFGDAGRILTEYIVFYTNRTHIITDIECSSIYYKNTDEKLLSDKTIGLGGIDKNGTGNPISDLFEFMLLQYGSPNGSYCTIKSYNGTMSRMFTCALSADKWHILI